MSEGLRQRRDLMDLVPVMHMSALSGKGENRANSMINTPGPHGINAHNQSQGYSIIPHNNQLAMTRLSRRQLSIGHS